MMYSSCLSLREHQHSESHKGMLEIEIELYTALRAGISQCDE